MSKHPRIMSIYYPKGSVITVYMSKHLMTLLNNWWNPGIILSIPEYHRIPRIVYHKGLWLVESRDNPEYMPIYYYLKL